MVIHDEKTPQNLFKRNMLKFTASMTSYLLTVLAFQALVVAIRHPVAAEAHGVVLHCPQEIRSVERTPYMFSITIVHRKGKEKIR